MGIELISLFETWMNEQGKSENTVATYRGVLQKFYQWLIEERNKDISEVTKEDVQAYMNFLDKRQKRSASTIDKVFATIRVFSQFLNKPCIIQNIEKKRKAKNIYQTSPKFLKKQEVDNLLKAIEIDGNLRNVAIVYTLLHTGIRISELCNLNYSDIEIKDQKGILVVKETQGKQQRVIPLSKEAIYHLQRYINTSQMKSGAMFVSNTNQRITTRAVQYMLKNYNISPLILRHTFCRDLIDKGVDIAIVAQLAGHSDINMTKRYQNKILRKSQNADTKAFA